MKSRRHRKRLYAKFTVHRLETLKIAEGIYEEVSNLVIATLTLTLTLPCFVIAQKTQTFTTFVPDRKRFVSGLRTSTEQERKRPRHRP